MRAYICGPLLSATDLSKARDFYSFLGQVCEECGFEPYMPHRHTDPVTSPTLSPTEVFERDYGAMINSNLIIAYVGKPSLGVGAELGIAFKIGIPTVALYQKDETVSRFLLGMIKKMERSHLMYYSDFDDCKLILKKHLNKVRKALSIGVT